MSHLPRFDTHTTGACDRFINAYIHDLFLLPPLSRPPPPLFPPPLSPPSLSICLHACVPAWGVCVRAQCSKTHGVAQGFWFLAPDQPQRCAGVLSNGYGSYFGDLFANAFGSFVMGALAASATLQLKTSKALAVLPRKHPWQVSLLPLMGLQLSFFGFRSHCR